jgi:hypothetical protein
MRFILIYHEKRDNKICFFIVISLIILINFSSALDVIYSPETMIGKIINSEVVLNINASVTVVESYSLLPWTTIIPPEGVFEPYNSSLSGTHVNTFVIKFTDLTLNPTDIISCDIRLSNGSDMILSFTGVTLIDENYTLNYTLTSSDPIENDPTNHYLPWILKNCTYTNSTGSFNESTNNSRIYVHSPIYWESSEVTRAIACRGTPGTYFNNTGKCEFSEDTLFALQMRNGNPVNETCFNNQGIACGNSYCNGIFFPTCDPLDYFGGYFAGMDDPNGYTAFNVSFSGYTTQLAYTRYTNTSGTFKLRLTQALSSKTFTITIYNLTNVSGANVYGNETGSGTTSVTPNGDGTYNVAHNRLSTPFTGTLDLTFNISFDSVLNQSRLLYIILGYGDVGNDGNPAYFNASFNPDYGFKNNNESENTSIAIDEGGRCGDEANNDFDYINGIWQFSYDCFDFDCNNNQGDNSQTNELGSGKTGICNYQIERNCTDNFDNDYDYIRGTDYTDCHDSNCFQNNSACPSVETICNDSLNNDWDYTLGETDFLASLKIQNNGTKYNSTYQASLDDCEDIDCNGSIGGSSGQLCNWGYETNCSDNFDNDALQLQDCDINAVANPTTNVTPAYGEYDCASYCRATNTSQETGSLCNDNKDNDLDAIIISGYYSDQYSSNTTSGAGIDCRWGGYFGYGANYNPDEDCNLTTLSNGYRCELARELNCTDGFDNDYDQNASGMPNSNWSVNTAGYAAYFNLTFSNDADFDDYDCQSNPLNPGNESLNASWCFDNIDNDLDAYYWNNIWILNSSTGKDCDDTDCKDVVNPSNPEISCSDYEYNVSLPQYDDPNRCSDILDNDLDSFFDCADTDCFQQFDMCSVGQCKSYENVSWDSCADSEDNDGGIGSDGTDCEDTDCLGMVGDTSGALCEATEADCSDNFDNDADDSIDCEDSDCTGDIGGIINNTNVYCRASESTISDCFDGFDNDADGATDCYDSSCNSQCNLTTISGTTPLSLPTRAGQTAINSASDAYIKDHTSRIKKGYWYNITLKDVSKSTHAQWTLGTASGGRFNTSKFNVSTAYLSGTDAANFTITETVNGFILESTDDFESGYEFSFLIRSVELLSSSTYELTWAEEYGSEQLSTGNYIPYEIVEDVSPQAQSIEIIPNSGMLTYGSSVYLRANISDNNQLGMCDWYVSGTGTFDPSNSTSCIGSFTPTQEGTYYVNVTPIDYYSNIGTSIQETYSLNIVPKGNSITLNRMFVNSTNLSILVNASFNLVATDSLGWCTIIAKNSTSEISIGSFAATGSNCYGTASASSLLEGVYSIYARVNEATDNNVIKGNETTFFVCNQIDTGICKYADFDENDWPDSCAESTPPEVNLLTPANDSTITSSNTVTFTYNVSDDVGISYCSLIMNDEVISTDYSIVNGATNSFTEDVNNDEYTWSVNCSDGQNVAQSEEYLLTVNVRAAGPGGGGGGGTTKFSLDKQQITVSLKPGETKSNYVIITNIADKKIRVNVSNTWLEDFIKVSETSFDLEVGETKVIIIDFFAREEKIPDVYIGKLIFQSGSTKKEILIAIEIESKQSLFDAKLEINEQYSQTYPGNKVLADIILYNLASTGKIPVTVDYVIKNEKGKVIYTETEILDVETQTRFSREFKIPEGTPYGRYILSMQAEYNGKMAISSDWFSVVEPSFWTKRDIIWLIVLTATITLLVIQYFIVKTRKSRRRPNR